MFQICKTKLCCSSLIIFFSHFNEFSMVTSYFKLVWRTGLTSFICNLDNLKHNHLFHRQKIVNWFLNSWNLIIHDTYVSVFSTLFFTNSICHSLLMLIPFSSALFTYHPLHAYHGSVLIYGELILYLNIHI